MSTDVVIVGAGPYGLSIAAHLAARGVEHRPIGRTMDTWERHMPDGMFLKSEGCASSIDEPWGRWTLRAFCQQAGLEYSSAGRPVPIETFRAYGRWFQQQLVPHVEEDEITAISRDGSLFTLQLSSGAQVTARRVVLACGIVPFAHIPPELHSLDQGWLSHTSRATDLGGFRNLRVAVLGAGQSALEAAALLHERGADAQLVARAPRLNWNPDPDVSSYFDTRRWRPRPTPLGAGRGLWSYWHSLPGFPLLPEGYRIRYVQRALGPAGAWWLRPRFEDIVPARLGATVLSGRRDNDALLLELAGIAGTAQVRVDHLVVGTGYRVDVERLTFLDPDLRSQLRRVGGAPVLSRHFESSVRGLYFTGLAAANTFGPAMRFVCGTRFAAPSIARHLRAQARRTRPRRARR
jgi:cation diffusion facilitator CzcD-associated flavoprotein CzcO